MFAVGNVSAESLGKLLSHLGAGPDGNCHVVITDVREELMVYVNGETTAPMQTGVRPLVRFQGAGG